MPERPIVVALDGSELSAAALPYARAIVAATGAPLLLVTVWEGTEPALATDLPAVANELTKLAQAYYQEYLETTAKRLRRARLRVETEVHIGHPVEEILQVIAHRRAAMVMLATHGRSGLRRWVYGSVAGRLAREAPVPTLVVGPHTAGDTGRAARIRRILVPLDGSPLAERALKPGADLAEALRADLLLARVIQFGAMAPPFGVPETYIPQIEQELVQGAATYLEHVATRLKTKRRVQTAALRGFPAEQLQKLSDAHDVGLVVMTSHTRTGPARALLGSVADRMLQGHAPVLLVRPPAARQAAAKNVAPAKRRRAGR
jgi:nucleotide-binding universal stress UspA family protein